MSTPSVSQTELADSSTAGAAHRIRWLDLLRAVAVAWVFLNHLSERIFGYPQIGNPARGWPPLADRIQQLAPLPEPGLQGIAANLLRYVGWAGDQGVQLFLVASGFAVTWSLLHRGEGARLDVASFLRRRGERIYPEWWAAHLALIAMTLVIGSGISPFSADTWLSMAGIRLTPGQLYYGVPAWWYVGLQLQLYLVYPLLWRGLRAWGPARFLLVTCGLALAVRAFGMLTLGGYLDAWSRGAIFVTRLPEFAVGIALAAWTVKAPGAVDRRLRRGTTILSAAALYAAGTVLALSLFGMAFAPFVLGVALVGLLYAPLRAIDARGGRLARALRFTGRHSYALYLVHQPCITALVPAGGGGETLVVRAVLSVLATLVAALVLEQAVAATRTTVRRWRRQIPPAVLVTRLAGIAALPLLFVYAGEWAVRRFDPQEVWGWGERPSLVPDPDFGWKLAPGKTTRLRWESYDYVVSANSLGFPGPEFSVEKPPGAFRILVTGDAFTSAEGVDTADAWPRQLERDLAACEPLGDRIEVLNFAITGYGPNQYAAVLRRYVPLYRPDLVLIGFFANEYDDVASSDEAVLKSIGFGQRDSDGFAAWIRAAHLRRFLEMRVVAPLAAWWNRDLTEQAAFFGYLSALETDREPLLRARASTVEERIEEITAAGAKAGAATWIVMIPTPIQVCDPKALLYLPAHFDLASRPSIDLDQPQRITREIAARLRVAALDVRPELKALEECPFQPRNLHLTRAGHSAVAASLAERICDWKSSGEVDPGRPGGESLEIGEPIP